MAPYVNGTQINGIQAKGPRVNGISPALKKLPPMHTLHRPIKAPVSSVVALPAKPVFAVATSAATAPSTPTIDPSTAASRTRPDVMHLTALGAIILSSSTQPVASVAPPHGPLLTTVVTAPVDPSIASTITAPAAIVQTAITSIQVTNTTAPQDQEHAKVWVDAINAAKTGGDLEVDGIVMQNPGLATVDNNGNITKIPLAAAADVQAGGTIVTESTGADAASPVTPAPTDSVAIPPALQTAVSGATDPVSTTPAGFVLAGTIKLPSGLEAERYTFHGTAGDEKTEMIVFTQSPLALNDILQTDGISFGDVKLVKPSISYYAANTTSGRAPGLWLEGSIVFTGGLSEIGEDLKDVFGQDSTELDITAHLGGFSSWKEAIKPPPDFSLQASMPSMKAQIGKYIEFNSWTITAQAVRVSDTATPPKQSYNWGFMFTGQLTLTTPGSVSPLLLDYGFNRQGTVLNMDMHLHHADDTWQNAMGIPGMNLNDAHFTAAYDKTLKGKGLSFLITASLKTDAADIEIKGTYGDDGWELNASMTDMTWNDLAHLYQKMFSIPLHDFNHNIVFKSTTLNVSSANKDIVLHSEVNVDDWAQVVSDITISTKGFHLTASIPQATFEHVTLETANLEIFVGKQGDVSPEPEKPGTSAYFTVSGKLSRFGMTLDAVAYLDKDPKLGLLWAVYAKVTDPLSLAKVLSLGSRSDLDFTLENVALMASNSDTLGPSMPQGLDYQVKKGFQLYAKVDCPGALSKALHTGASTLTLEADLAGDTKEVDLIFASNPGLTLKAGMASETIKAGIIITDVPSLFVAADISVQLSGQPAPLDFEFRLDVNPTEAKATASLLTDWINPFNISPKVKVLQPVSLGVVIVFASPVYPSGLSFQGGFQVGETAAHAAFEVTDNPKDGVLQIGVTDLGIKDIISFASLVVEHDLPQPASDFLFFEEMNFGISTGANIGSTYYPAGATFSAKMDVFGKKASIDCEFNKEAKGIKVHGEVEPFSLGPLTVSGKTSPNLVVDLNFTPDAQHLMIDGQVKLWEIDAGITVTADLHPLDLTFDGELAFSDALDFKLQAHVAGEIHSLKDLLHSDFTFDFEFEQHILDDIMARANTYILAAKTAVDEGMESAKKKLDDAEKEYNDFLNSKQSELDAAKATWDKKNQDTLAAAAAKKAQILADEASKKKSVDDAKAKLDAYISSLERKLQNAKDNAANEIGKAQKAVNDEKSKVDNEVNGKVHDLQKAQDALSHSFGSADNALNSAKSKVAGAQRDLDGANRDLDNARNDYNHANRLQKIKYRVIITEKEAVQKVKQAALGVAQAALSVAEKAVNGAGYQLAHQAVNVAQGALDAAKKAGEAAMDVANKTLDETKKAQSALISATQTELDNAKKGCDQSHAWDAAKAVLTAYMNTEAGLLEAVAKAVTELESCAEKLAYDAAVAAIAVARSATKEVDLAKSAVSAVEGAADEMAALGTWMVKNVGNIFNVRKIALSGSLQGATAKPPVPLHAEIDGVFADKEVHLAGDFTPGQAEAFLKSIFEQILAQVKADLGSFVKSHL